MAKQVTEIQVFVACPGDMAKAKKRVKLVCDEINQNPPRRCGVRLLMKDWEASTVLEFSSRPQKMILAQISDYDVFIGILGNRFGTPTGAINPHTGQQFQSGTEEEFYDAYNKWRKTRSVRINVYFKRGQTASTSAEVQQLEKVLKFKEKIRDELRQVPLEFASPLDLERKVRTFLQKVVWDFDEQIGSKEAVHPPERAVAPQRITYPAVQCYLPRRVVRAKELKRVQWSPLSNDLAKDLVEVMQLHNRVVLLGDAGSGKTTELRRVAAESSRESSDFYPFLCLLSRFTNQPLSNMLDRSWQRVPEEQLLVILDGLDEVPPGDQNQAIRQVESFAEDHPAAQILVSCRTNFYHVETDETPGSLLGFRSYALLDLAKEEVRQYVDTRL